MHFLHASASVWSACGKSRSKSLRKISDYADFDASNDWGREVERVHFSASRHINISPRTRSKLRHTNSLSWIPRCVVPSILLSKGILNLHSGPTLHFMTASMIFHRFSRVLCFFLAMCVANARKPWLGDFQAITDAQMYGVKDASSTWSQRSMWRWKPWIQWSSDVTGGCWGDEWTPGVQKP